MFRARLLRHRKAASAVEYALIAALIALSLVGSLYFLGWNVGNRLDEAGNSMGAPDVRQYTTS